MQQFSSEVIAEVLQCLADAGGAANAANAANAAGVAAQLAPRVQAVLTRLQNAAYTEGFTAARAPVQTHMFGAPL